MWCFEEKFQGDGKNLWKLEGLTHSYPQVKGRDLELFCGVVLAINQLQYLFASMQFANG